MTIYRTLEDGAMGKGLSILAVLFVIIVGISGCDCSSEDDMPKMTATEVCQYVNQALTDEYTYATPILRLEKCYTALGAQYIGKDVGDNYIWEVSVEEKGEIQLLRDGQWILDLYAPGPTTTTLEYYFNETSAALSTNRPAIPLENWAIPQD